MSNNDEKNRTTSKSAFNINKEDKSKPEIARKRTLTFATKKSFLPKDTKGDKCEKKTLRTSSKITKCEDNNQSTECKKNETHIQSDMLQFEDVPKYNQFEENEKRFGIKPVDFDESLYTTKLDKDSEFYKKNVEEAKKLEKEILKSKNNKNSQNDNDDRYSCILKRKDCGKK